MLKNIGMIFYLVANGFVLCVLEELAEVCLVEVGNTQRRGELALVLHVLEDLPEGDNLSCLGNKRVVNKEEVRVKA
jgi:hypothetical protein